MDSIVVLDFGGQYSHLISRRVRDLGVYSRVMQPNATLEELKAVEDLKGIILSGGAASVYDKDSPKCGKEVLELGVPVLGICYGHQLIAELVGGDVESGKAGEYGLTQLSLKNEGELASGLSKKEGVWMNHKDVVRKLPEGFEVTGSTSNSPVAAFENSKEKIYGVQFHPEVTHTKRGMQVLENFVVGICKARKQWDTSKIIERIKAEIKQKLEGKKAVIGLSGGVDSSIAAALVSSVVGEDLTAVYVDTGLMRHEETKFIKETFNKYPFKLIVVDAADRFFKALKGVTEPERKRKIIGKTFIDVFEEKAKTEKSEVLIQGTIYSDRIESGITKHSDTIKSHHNVGGLPENMKLEVYEPLRDLYKDEVRKIGEKLGVPRQIVQRQVFPGPGLAVRIIGEVTPERAEIVRKASHIIEEELKSAKLYDGLWMSFAVLLPIKSVGIQGDARSYKYPVVVRVIESEDAMTANFYRIPYDVLEKISTRITNEITQVNRVVYDVSNKPPATMEWE